MADGRLLDRDGKPIVIDQISNAEISSILSQLEGQASASGSSPQVQVGQVDRANLRAGYAGQFTQTSMENTIYTKTGKKTHSHSHAHKKKYTTKPVKYSVDAKVDKDQERAYRHAVR